jgi:hypothetical protein
MTEAAGQLGGEAELLGAGAGEEVFEAVGDLVAVGRGIEVCDGEGNSEDRCRLLDEEENVVAEMMGFRRLTSGGVPRRTT